MHRRSHTHSSPFTAPRCKCCMQFLDTPEIAAAIQSVPRACVRELVEYLALLDHKVGQHHVQ